MKKNLLLLVFCLLSAITATAQYVTGTTSPYVTYVYTYTFNRNTIYMSVSWQASGGTVLSSYSAGYNYYATILWNTISPPNTITVKDNYNTTVGSLSVTLKVPDPNTTYTTTQSCGSTIITRTTNPPSGVNWYWQTSSTGTSTTLGYASTITRTTTGLWMRARWGTSGIWSDNTQVVPFTITTSLSPPASSTDGHRISNTAVTVPVSVSSVSGATSYRWFTQSTGGTAISGPTTASWSPSLSATQSYWVEGVDGSCVSTSRKQVTANVYPEPILAATNSGVVTQGVPVTLSVSNPTYATYEWLDSNGNPIAGATSTTYQTFVPGAYKVRVAKNGSPPFTSVPINVTDPFLSQNLNYVFSNTIQKENVTTISQVALLPVEHNARAVQYFDGLGRPMQSVSVQGSPLKKDIVVPTVYDALGREFRKYLPVVPNENTGVFKTGILDGNFNLAGNVQNFYNNSTDNIADDLKPWAESKFEASPLSRVIKQGAPGTDWQPDATVSYSSDDHTIKSDWQVNVSNDNVINWHYNETGTTLPIINIGYYTDGQLLKSKTKDEEQHEVFEFKDKQGRTILKKVQAPDGEWAQTYYIYDTKGNLALVLSPEATKALTN